MGGIHDLKYFSKKEYIKAERGVRRVRYLIGYDTLFFILNFSRSLMVTLPHKHSHTKIFIHYNQTGEGWLGRTDNHIKLSHTNILINIGQTVPAPLSEDFSETAAECIWRRGIGHFEHLIGFPVFEVDHASI